MRRVALLLGLIAVVAPPAPAGALARAETRSCDSKAGTATFRGTVTQRPGAHRMQMRFTLRALSGGRWARVAAAGFGRWRTSQPGVGRYVLTRTVENLPAPGAYRVRVAFRWLDAGGRVVAVRVRRSPVCRIRDPRPDLRPLSVVARPGGWAVVVRNSGRRDAGRFQVAAAVDGAEPRLREVAGVSAGREVIVAFDGSCIASVRVVVDAADTVDERDEEDNVLEAPCPALG